MSEGEREGGDSGEGAGSVGTMSGGDQQDARQDRVEDDGTTNPGAGEISADGDGGDDGEAGSDTE